MSTASAPTSVPTGTNSTSTSIDPSIAASTAQTDETITQTEKDQRTAEAKTAFTATLTSVGANLDTDVRGRAQIIHDNASTIASQQTDLQTATKQLAKQNAEIGKLADQGRQALKEVGDLGNWAEMLERDMMVLDEALGMAEEEDEREGRTAKKETRLRRWF